MNKKHYLGVSRTPKCGMKQAGKFYRAGLLGLTTVSALVVPALAEGEEGGGDALSILSNLNDMIFSVVRLVGIAGAIWGIVQLGMSISGHDPSQRLQGILTLVGSLLIIFAREILQAIGAM